MVRSTIVDQYVYLRHILSFDKEHQQKEITKRMLLRGAAFSKLGDILKSIDIGVSLKWSMDEFLTLSTMFITIYQYVLPSMTCRIEIGHSHRIQSHES